MDEPAEELRADAGERGELPDFEALTDPEEVISGGRTRDDFFETVLGLDEAAPVSEIADRAGHGVDAAREYLAWFERMGIVTRVTESPATYQRNQAYLDWRRVQRLREEFANDELVDMLAEETERADAYAQSFGVDVPDDVSVTGQASERGESVAGVWEDVAAWRTARRRIRLLERALQTDASDGATERPAV
ncbi:DUF7342 family protein [Natranaeroarchaeum aerophilus]|uniref:Sugar-specific transcriptional regulator TrmB n=1 Tax=Natranaeroarchaeum aerophilus TaxID=2917711 RepID=A0AAE3FPR6_9EURY|nr:hypothetical protein [Natranaeroarchaeum aerophilus]MCL9812994.1 hypothetical protein [Natranaeroarchaeum aerophilus]